MEYGIAEPERLGTTDLPDGRRLGWAQWGPADGRPVLFFSGAAMGRALGFGTDVLDRHGIRLIAVDRPGLGASACVDRPALIAAVTIERAQGVVE